MEIYKKKLFEERKQIGKEGAAPKAHTTEINHFLAQREFPCIDNGRDWFMKLSGARSLFLLFTRVQNPLFVQVE